MAGAEPPKMQVGKPVAFDFNGDADRVGKPLARHNVEQNATRAFDKTDRRAHDDERADETHERIEPAPTEKSSGDERDHRQHRRQRVGEHMHIGRPQIAVLVRRVGGGLFVVLVRMVPVVPMVLKPMMIVLVMAVAMLMRAMGMMVRIAPIAVQKPGARQIDAKADDRDGNRFAEGDRHR